MLLLVLVGMKNRFYSNWDETKKKAFAPFENITFAFRFFSFRVSGFR